MIILLIVCGLVFLFAELFLLPGLSVGAFLSLACYGGAVYVAFDRFSTETGLWCIAAIVVLSLIVIAVSLRSKTWRRLSLEQRITSSNREESMPVAVGERGRTVSRRWAASSSQAVCTRPSRRLAISTRESRSRLSTSMISQ